MRGTVASRRDVPSQHASRGVRIGLDIGGTKIEAVALSSRGELLGDVRRPTRRGADGVLATAITAVEDVCRVSGVPQDGLASVGVGVPGTVDRETGTVSHAVNLGVTALDLGPHLARRFDLPVAVENDVNAAALGVHHHLALGDSRSLAFVNAGTGLAAGLVLGGRLWRGSRGAAGEIGHVPAGATAGAADVVCACGQTGCAELWGSGSGVARQLADSGDRPGAREDDRRGQALAGFVHQLASTIRSLVLTVDVDVVALGGGMAEAVPAAVDDVRAVLATWSAQSPFLRSLNLGDRLVQGPQGPVAALGAALLPPGPHSSPGHAKRPVWHRVE